MIWGCLSKICFSSIQLKSTSDSTVLYVVFAAQLRTMLSFKTFATCTLAQIHVAAEKHCSAFNRAEAYAKIQQYPFGLFTGLLQTDRFLFVALHMQATYQLSTIASNLKRVKGKPGWAAA